MGSPDVPAPIKPPAAPDALDPQLQMLMFGSTDSLLKKTSGRAGSFSGAISPFMKVQDTTGYGYTSLADKPMKADTGLPDDMGMAAGLLGEAPTTTTAPDTRASNTPPGGAQLVAGVDKTQAGVAPEAQSPQEIMAAEGLLSVLGGEPAPRPKSAVMPIGIRAKPMLAKPRTIGRF
jgi:hypothetical protein